MVNCGVKNNVDVYTFLKGRGCENVYVLYTCENDDIFGRPFKIEYHSVDDTWYQPLLSCGKWCTELKIGSLIY